MMESGTNGNKTPQPKQFFQQQMIKKSHLKQLTLLALLATAALPHQATAQANPGQQRAVLAYLKSGQEPTAKDATFTNPTMLKVGVIDNQSNRDGYANYMCQVLADHGVRGTRVQIIDIRKLVQTNKWVKLGESGCW